MARLADLQQQHLPPPQQDAQAPVIPAQQEAMAPVVELPQQEAMPPAVPPPQQAMPPVVAPQQQEAAPPVIPPAEEGNKCKICQFSTTVQANGNAEALECGCVYHTYCIEQWMQARNIPSRATACVLAFHHRMVIDGLAALQLDNAAGGPGIEAAAAGAAGVVDLERDAALAAPHAAAPAAPAAAAAEAPAPAAEAPALAPGTPPAADGLVNVEAMEF